MRNFTKIFVPSILVSTFVFAGCNQQTTETNADVTVDATSSTSVANSSADSTSTLNSDSARETKNTSQGTMKEFKVVAKRFVFEPATLRVKKGDTVRLQITSMDTDHGFAIAEFGVNATIPAGKTVTVEFVADRQGTFTTQCSVFCGTGHPDMQGTLIVE